jgi:signal transduction histidine kinase
MDRSKLFAWAVALAAIATMGYLGARGSGTPPISVFFLWSGLLAASELLSVSLAADTQVTMAFPIHLALAIIFRHQPFVAMLIAYLGALDVREFRREITLHRALFNRATAVFSVGAACIPFAMWSSGPFQILPVVIAALLHLVTNLVLVSGALFTERRLSPRKAVHLLIPSPVAGFFVSYALLTGLGVATALAYTRIDNGGWAVAAILIPLLFARLGIVGARAQQELSDRLRLQQQALLEATEKLFHEREDERKRVAAQIHDSSLQSLAAAAYASGNALEFLRQGREEGAMEAMETTQTAVVGAIGELRESLVDLRGSAWEEGTLGASIDKFADRMSTLWGVEVKIEHSLRDEPPIPVAQAVFQILQEAVTNALKHSEGKQVVVRVSDDDGMVRVVVQDEGEGFDPEAQIGEDHVGMRLMHERAAQVGGKIEVDSVPGRGTRLEATIPGGAG